MERNKKELLKAILDIKNTNFLERFLKDLLTPTEFREIVKRWQVVKELSKKTPQRKISQKLKVGRATITRGSRVLISKNSALRKILNSKK